MAEDPEERQQDVASVSSSTGMSPEEQFQRVARTDAFKEAAVTVERMLACNTYRRQLQAFRGLSRPPPCDYLLQHLWSFQADEELQEGGVSALCWNPANEDVLAVGYAYGDSVSQHGTVRCWNVKNPVHAERHYVFNHSVTALHFSAARPNLAAVGLHDGSLLLLDVSSERRNIVGCSSRDTSTSRGPVWQARWFAPDTSRPDDEQVLTCDQEGRVCRYERPVRPGLECFPVTRLARVSGPLRGLRQPRKCAPLDIPVSQHPAALVVARHPEQPQLYYVGTEEGVVHKCSFTQKRRPLDCFVAHHGPVYGLCFSPFHAGLLLSCGADWKVRLWAEGVWEPVLTLACGTEPVQAAAWSPVNSTMLAAVAGGEVLVWDLRRRAASPVRRCAPCPSTPGGKTSSCTTLLFTADGRNLVVGDANGAVHVLALSGTPPAPLLPRQALCRVLRAALHAYPARLKQLDHLL